MMVETANLAELKERCLEFVGLVMGVCLGHIPLAALNSQESSLMVRSVQSLCPHMERVG